MFGNATKLDSFDFTAYTASHHKKSPLILYEFGSIGYGRHRLHQVSLLSSAERISVENIRFDKAWNNSMAVRGSAKFDSFYDNLEINVSVNNVTL